MRSNQGCTVFVTQRLYVRPVSLMDVYFKCILAVSISISKVTEIGMIINEIITPV